MDPSNSWDEGWQEVQDPVLTSLPVDSSEDLMQPATGSGLDGVDLASETIRLSPWMVPAQGKQKQIEKCTQFKRQRRTETTVEKVVR